MTAIQTEYSRELITPPVVEPLDLESEVKKNSNVDHDEDDGFLTALIKVSRTHVEAWTGRQLITAQWKMYLDCFPDGDIILPFGSLQSVDGLTYTDINSVPITWLPVGNDLKLNGVTKAHVDTKSVHGRIILPFSGIWPTTQLHRLNPIAITFTCGYGLQNDVPATIKQAMLLLIEQWYKNRDIAVVGKSVTMVELPFAAAALLMPLRIAYF